jgi:putative ABC transport system permease protein
MKFRSLISLSLRDTRRHRTRLAVFSLAISIGIATVVAVGSLRADLLYQIEVEARDILGADVAVRGFFAVPDSLLTPFRNGTTDMATEQSMASMVRKSGASQSRLVNVRAVSQGFPLYGHKMLGSEALSAGGALVSQNLGYQLGLSVGDTLRIGAALVPVVGIYDKGPGQSGIAATVAPGLYISQQTLTQTGLVTYGSRIQYSYYFKTNNTQEAETLKDQMEAQIVAAGARVETVADSQRRMSSAYDNLIKFLNIIGFVALVLGVLSIASAVGMYLHQKVRTAAVLRCLGMGGRDLAAMYFFQVAAISLVGASLGAVLGWGLQGLISNISEGFLPVRLSVTPHFGVMALGVVLGVLLTLGMSVFKLFALSGVSAMHLLREGLAQRSDTYDVRGLSVAALLLYLAARILLGSWGLSLWYLLGLLIVLLLLAGLTRALMWGLRNISGAALPFTFRFGLAAIRRPGNQSTLLMTALGVGMFMVFTLAFVQHSVLSYLDISEQAGKANLVLFDVTREQRDSVKEVLKAHHAVVTEEISMVPMRLSALKGRSVQAWQKDTSHRIPDHIFYREYRVTSRGYVADNEEITSGEWPPAMTDAEVVPISVEYYTAEQMQVAIGDRLEFNIYGIPFEVEVAAIRRVDFTRFQSSFTIVFPPGVIDDAPQTYAFITGFGTESGVESRQKVQLAQLQNDLLDRFKNISLVDLRTIRETLTDVMLKVRFAINFMASLSFITACIVLIITLYLTRYRRIRETVLLRTLGIKNFSLAMVNFYEFFTLALLAVAAAILLSTGASWTVTAFVFRIPYSADTLWIPTLGIAVIVAVSAVGVWSNRRILRTPPLEIIRRENA